MSPARIVYVEDDVCLLREALAAEGVIVELVHVSTPKDFSTALRIPPDLILADGKVAGFGATATWALARAPCPRPQVPLFSLSGLVTDEKMAAMRKAGVAGCLSKQDMALVSATIKKALDDRSCAEGIRAT